MSEVACRVIILMGVTGCGKTTIGQLLSKKMEWSYHDADDFHPKANVDKMASGVPLEDQDRWPWLDRLSVCVGDWIRSETGAVLACSALKEVYRKRLISGRKEVAVVHLVGNRELIAERLEKRLDHYMPTSLLESQFQTLEPPSDAIIADITKTPEEIVRYILSSLKLGS